jgi:hypothetical protein
MAYLPQPDDLTSLVLRVDFSDDTAWEMLQAAIDSSDAHRDATYVSDPAFAGVTVQALVDMDAAASDNEKVTYLFLADATTMTDGEHSLLAVDLYTEPGRTFRLPPGWFVDVSANLSIANMDFAEFADVTDGSGTFRGFAGE